MRQRVHHARRGVSVLEQREPFVAVAEVVPGLRRAGADAGTPPRDVRADAQRLRRDGDAARAGLVVDGDDRVGQATAAAAACRRRCSRTSGSILAGTSRSSKFSVPTQREKASSKPFSGSYPSTARCRGDLALQLAVEVEQRAGLRPAEVEVVEVDESRELRDRLLVVVHAQVDGNVEAAAVRRARLPDANGCGLLSTAVATCGIARRERTEQTPYERLVGGGPVGLEHPLHDVLAGEDVPLHRHLAVDDAARPGQALAARVVGRAAGEIGHPELPPRRELVGAHQLGHDLGRRAAGAQEREPVGTVGEVRKRLRRDCTRVRAAPRNRVADGEAL